MYALFGTTIALSDPVHGNDKETNMKKQKQNPQDQELRDQQLEKAAGGTQNQLWGDWFIIDEGRAIGSDAGDLGSNDGDLATEEGGDDPSQREQ